MSKVDERELKEFTRGQLDAALCEPGKQAGVSTARGIRMLLSGELVIQRSEKPQLLKPTGDPFVLPAQSGAFNVGEQFAEGKHADGVEIFATDSTFREKFGGKVESGVPEVRITPYELTDESRDPAIITALGGKDRAEISLRHLRELMRRTQNGEVTVIQPGANVFYARDAEQVLWAFDVFWRDVLRGWHVLAHSVEDPGPWPRGDRVFSCDS